MNELNGDCVRVDRPCVVVIAGDLTLVTQPPPTGTKCPLRAAFHPDPLQCNNQPENLCSVSIATFLCTACGQLFASAVNSECALK